MADKSKRLRKILLKSGLKGVFKPVNTLEEAHIIKIDGKPIAKFVGVDTYKQWLDEGRTFPEESIHYLISSNPRNRWQMEHRFFANSGFMKEKFK